jgi:hypothetical protein
MFEKGKPDQAFYIPPKRKPHSGLWARHLTLVVDDDPKLEWQTVEEGKIMRIFSLAPESTSEVGQLTYLSHT